MSTPQHSRPNGWIIAVLVSAALIVTLCVLTIAAAILVPWMLSERNDALEENLRDDVSTAGRTVYDQQNTPDWEMVYKNVQDQQSMMGENPYGTPGTDLSLAEWAGITGTAPIPVSSKNNELVLHLGDGRKGDFCLVGWDTTDPDSPGYPYGDFYYDPMLDTVLDTYELQDAYYSDELTPACADLVLD